MAVQDGRDVADALSLLQKAKGFTHPDVTVARSRVKVPWLYAVFSAFSPSFSIVCSRITNFWILPVMVIGNSATNSM